MTRLNVTARVVGLRLPGILLLPAIVTACSGTDHFLGAVDRGGEGGQPDAWTTGGGAIGGRQEAEIANPSSSETGDTAGQGGTQPSDASSFPAGGTTRQPPDASDDQIGGASSQPEGHADGGTAQMPSRSLMLELTPEFDDPAGTGALESWLFTVNLPEGASGRGWFGGTGERLKDGTTRRFGSPGVEASVSTLSGTVTVVPELLDIAGPTYLDFDAIELSVDAAGSVTGTAIGQSEIQGVFGVYRSHFSASVTGRPDDEAPIASTQVGPLILPVDGIYVSLAEPIVSMPFKSTDLRGVGESGEILASGWWRGVSGGPPGFALGYTLRVENPLPVGELVEVWLMNATDMAGNVAPRLKVGSTRVAATPQGTADNFGFESGLDGWIPQYQTTEARVITSYELADWDDADGEPMPIRPPEGSAMAWIPAHGRLAGYVEFPEDATELCMQVGILHERLAEVPEDFVVFSVGCDGEHGGSRSGVPLQTFFVPYTHPMSGWSGFREQCKSWPSAGPGLYWLTISGSMFIGDDTSMEQMSPRLDHELLIDALYFR